MADLRYTPLRHKMLAQIASSTPDSGGVTRSREWGGAFTFGIWLPRGHGRLDAFEKRTTKQLYDAHAVREVHSYGPSMYSSKLLGLTAAGTELLVEWDSQYGKVE